MALGSLEFAELLTEAAISAVAYGYQHCPIVDANIPCVSLVGRQAEPLLNAFKQFEAWSQDTDGDAVDFTFVLRGDRGYLVGLGPERERLEHRCLGFDRTSPPIVVAMTWVKALDTTGPQVAWFREYCNGLVRPFYLRAAIYGGASGGAAFDPSLVRSIPGCPEILKFSATFADESAVVTGTQPWLVLKTSRRSRKGSRRPTPVDGAHSRRSTVLETHFPVTLERIRRELSSTGLGRALASEGLRRWQIDQAVCNLVLSSELVDRPHFEGVPSRQLDRRISDALRTRFEVADGNAAAVTTLTCDLIWAQAEYDARILVKKAGGGSNSRRWSLPQLLLELERRRLLDPEESAK